MKRFFMTVLAFALLAGMAQAADVASLTERFQGDGWVTDKAKSFYQNKTSIVHETPTLPGDFTGAATNYPNGVANYSPNGFAYGGWCAGPPTDTTNNYNVQFGGQGSASTNPNTGYVPTLPCIYMGKVNAASSTIYSAVAGTYFYTIFDTAGGANANTTVKNVGSVAFITPQANATSEENSANFAVLLRDASGNWFQQVDNLMTIPMTLGVENTVSLTLAGVNFQQLTGGAPADMNQMDDSVDNADFTPGAITLDGTNTTAPADVTGIGLVQMSALTQPGGNVAPIKFIEWRVTGSLAGVADWMQF